MKALNAARFVLAFFVVAFQPPAVLLWVAIHPFASFWRRLGPAWTYSLLGIPVAGYVAIAWVLRDFLLGRDLGASPPLMVLAAILAVTGSWLNRQRRKQLTFANLSGMAELSLRHYPGRLLTEGIYSRLRHPRYVEVHFFVLAYALFANYTGAYAVAVLSLLLMLWVVPLEERELRRRFGKEYEEYCRRVPRFAPRWRGGRK
ncbi:MAG: isoprenylcysteine carboxylmethyltransferase family protein [Acidobacteria bacterium]|jgi:protein-S-isoprenylcysteine O-methyltransferase Ste14|nr:isoprenylcysteine carboxylmethyltransferase family protein [Acidobacteriota bacterium]